MKQNLILRLVILIIAAGMAVYFGACKKEIITPINNSSNAVSYDDPNYTDEASKIVGKIKKFKTQVVEKEYLTKGDSFMPLDSVIWNVEALFNASYTFPDRKYVETVKQSLEFFVSVNDQNEVPISVVADLYDDVIDAVRQAYANDGINVDKSLMAVDVEKGEKNGDTISIIVYVISGRVNENSTVTTPVEGPFGPGDCWYFGEYGGSCDDPSVLCDAAEIIEDSINFYFRGTRVPNTEYRSINFNVTKVLLEGNEYVDENGNYYIYFYSINENTPYYLDYDLLNYYYYKELVLILNVVPTNLLNQGSLPPNPVFLEVDINGLIGCVNNHICAQHHHTITYCSKELIPVTVLGNPLELL